MKFKIMYTHTLADGRELNDYVFHTLKDKAEQHVAFLLFSKNIKNVSVKVVQ